MNSNRRGAALSRAARSLARTLTHTCETLERRLLLSGEPVNDPVIVLTEPFSLDTWPTVTSETVDPWLWKNPDEFLWDLDDWDASPPPWDNVDGDGNGYRDDAYGWNFGGPAPSSPNIIGAHGGLGGGAAHGATIVDKMLRVLNGAGTPDDVRVRIMHVIGQGYQIVDHIQWHKAHGVNIVAVSNSTAGGVTFNREDAEDLRDNGILVFVGSGNLNSNMDLAMPAPEASSFYHATPRFSTQLPSVPTIIPVTTDPSVVATDYGINSFYFAASDVGLNIDAQSFAIPVAATYAALAVEAYQDAHNGADPTADQVKRAMMSGVTYQSNLNNKTITHDYVSGVRLNGGRLNLGRIITALNDSGPGITGVSMSPVGAPVGTTVTFDLDSTGEPTDWTISWGDNSGADASGVEVLLGSRDQAEHPFPRDIQPHKYYPTIYAMLGSGTDRKVYLPSSQSQAVVITSPTVPTDGKDEYTLSRSGDNLVVTLVNAGGTFSQTFDSDDLPRSVLELGEGGDTVTINYTNGDPLAFTELTVRGGTSNLIRIIGSPAGDTIDNEDLDITVDGTVIRKPFEIPVSIDGAGGNDQLISDNLWPATLVGGAGDDLFDLRSGTHVVRTAGGGNDTLSANTAQQDAARARITSSETFSNIGIFTGGAVVMDAHGSFVLRSGSMEIEEEAFLDLKDNAMILDELAPPALETVRALLASGRNGGAWNGDGIRSSVANASQFGVGYAEASDIFTTFPATFAGEQVDQDAVLLKYTLYGDADLDGDVDLDDFNRLAPNFNTTGKVWSQGDFDYDGDVDLNDFNLFAGNWGQGSGFASGAYAAQSSSSSSSSPGTGGNTVEDLLGHLLNGGTGLPIP